MTPVFGSRDIVIDNTLLTAATRALRDGPNCSDFDFLALVELSQDLICYEHLVLDGSSRTRAEDKESWDRATSPWRTLQTYAIRAMADFPDLEIREKALDEAARIAVVEATEGTYTKIYQEACASLGVRHLLPAFYRSDAGLDDIRFREAERFLRETGVDLSGMAQHQDAGSLARYVFRGFYYYQVAISAKINYAPCALRAKLMIASRLATKPSGELATRLTTEAARLKDLASQQEMIEFLTSAGLRLSYEIALASTSAGELKVPFMFLYIMKMCEQNPSLSVPEAVIALRRRKEIAAFRENIHKILTDIRSEALTPQTRDDLTRKLDEMSRLLQNLKYARGLEPAKLSLLPFLDLGAAAAKPFLSFLKALPKPVQEWLSVRIPKWMFEEHHLKDRLIVMWQLFEQRAELKNAREMFERYWISRNP